MWFESYLYRKETDVNPVLWRNFLFLHAHEVSQKYPIRTKKLHFIYTLFSNHIHSDVYVCISVDLYNIQKDAPKTK
jgi:hypothetical protein